MPKHINVHGWHGGPVTEDQKKNPHRYMKCGCGEVLSITPEQWNLQYVVAKELEAKAMTEGRLISLLHLQHKQLIIELQDFLAVQWFEVKHPQLFKNAIRSPERGKYQDVAGHQMAAFELIAKDHRRFLVDTVSAMENRAEARAAGNAE